MPAGLLLLVLTQNITQLYDKIRFSARWWHGTLFYVRNQKWVTSNQKFWDDAAAWFPCEYVWNPQAQLEFYHSILNVFRDGRQLKFKGKPQQASSAFQKMARPRATETEELRWTHHLLYRTYGTCWPAINCVSCNAEINLRKKFRREFGALLK